MDPRLRLFSSDDDLLADPTTYRYFVGHLLYLIISLPNLSFVIHKLSQFMSKPCKAHLAATHDLLHYLKPSPSQGIFLPVIKTFQIRAFADAD